MYSDSGVLELNIRYGTEVNTVPRRNILSEGQDVLLPRAKAEKQAQCSLASG